MRGVDCSDFFTLINKHQSMSFRQGLGGLASGNSNYTLNRPSGNSHTSASLFLGHCFAVT